jgi:hypothetical protein
LLDEFGKVMRQDRGRREGEVLYLHTVQGWMDAYYMHSAKAHSTVLKKRIEMCTFHSTEEWWFALSTQRKNRGVHFPLN